MRSGVVALALCLSLLLFGCGGDDAGSSPAEDGEQDGIEISGDSKEDERIAADLSEYADRLCSDFRGVSRSEYVAGFAGNDPQVEAIRQSFIERYGSLPAAYSANVERCESYEEIAVTEGAISVRTSLEGEGTDILSAEDTCQLIQGSDVADFTAGHKVLDETGEVLVTCRERR